MSTISHDDQWVSRSTLPAIKSGNSLVFGGDPADKLVPVSLQELAGLRAISQATWTLTTLKDSDRVLVSTTQQGGFPVGMSAEVIAPLCSAISYAQPRGRLRLLQTIKNFKPTVWVTTPCAALDFLARLYMEFNIDPFELGIEHIVLVGEIASQGTHKRLADEFEATITDMYCDPIFGAALALRKEGRIQSGEAGLIALAALNENKIISDDANAKVEAEIVLKFSAIEALDNLIIRTGQIISPAEPVNCFHRTVGDQVLARGHWIPLPLLSKALKLIDGIQAWHLQIERGEGTLDRITLKMGLNRDTLVSNPMWQARIREALAAVTPLTVEIDSYLLTADDPQPESVVADHRNHHIGGCTGLNNQGGWAL